MKEKIGIWLKENWFKLMITLVIVILSPLSSVNAYGEIRGTSLGEFSSCDYYLIEDSSGSYSLVEWYGGSTPYSGNTVVGELHSYGFKDLYNISRDNSTHVWIDDWLLSEDSAAKKLIEKCGYDRSISTYFDGGGYYVSSYTPPVNPAPTCPANSSSVNGQCTCDPGYKASENACITATQSCQNQYGTNSYGDSQYCYCSPGYQWNSTKTSCVLIPSCPDGSVINSNGQCITYTQDCQNTFGNNIVGSKGPNNNSTCNCEPGYLWNQDRTACILVKEQPTTTVSTVIFTTTTTTTTIYNNPIIKQAHVTKPAITTTTISQSNIIQPIGSSQIRKPTTNIFSIIKAFLSKIFNKS